MEGYAERYLAENNLEGECDSVLRAMAEEVVETGKVPVGKRGLPDFFDRVKARLYVRSDLDFHDLQIYCRVHYGLEVRSYLSDSIGKSKERARLRAFRRS